MPDIDPVLLSDARILTAYAIFVGSYFVFALGKFPCMKIQSGFWPAYSPAMSV